MKKWIEELNELTTKNPELPVTIIYEGAGKGRLWATDNPIVFIDEVTVSTDGESFIYDPTYRETDYVLQECLSAGDYFNIPLIKEERQKAYDALEWERSIIVYVS